MLTPQSRAAGGVEIPEVDEGDVKRFWLRLKQLMSDESVSKSSARTTGYNLRLFEATL